MLGSRVTERRYRCMDNEEQAAGFYSARGTGQGDVLSPACWVAVLDILLTALEIDEAQSRETWICSEANLEFIGRDTAYADDLVSATRDAAGL